MNKTAESAKISSASVEAHGLRVARQRRGSLPALVMPLLAVLLLAQLGCIQILGYDDERRARPGTCGDGALQGEDICDDGNVVSGDGCSPDCQIEHGFVCVGLPSACATDCGDGLVAASEGCDDGNNMPGDGCDADCRVEDGATCDEASEPSACAFCGNGTPSPPEGCDDGNLMAGDGCDPGCQPEPGWACTDDAPSTCSRAAVRVEAGDFAMGCAVADTSCGADEEQHVVTLSPFEIDMTEVTVAAYEACLAAAGGCGEAPDVGAACNWGVDGREGHPVNCVSWQQARSYCLWEGKRLPTEAEWEKAARGSGGRIYPWGNQAATCDRAVMADGGDGCGQGTTWAAGAKPLGESPYGALDMAGNVWEWVLDLYDKDYYGISPPSDPQGPVQGDDRVFRGGAWASTGGFLRTSHRNHASEDTRSDNVGFRCARTVP